MLRTETQVSLRQLTAVYPIEKGLTEIIAFLNIASRDKKALINEDVMENITVSNRETEKKFEIHAPQVIFCR